MSEGKILIIHSDEKMTNLMKLVLVNRGFEVAVSFSGRQSLDIFGSTKFDAIFVDMNLRDIDPVSIINEFRKKDIDVMILAMTPENAVQSIQESISSGAFDYIVYPFRAEDVYFKVKRAIANRKALLNNKIALKGLDERNISLQKQNIMLAKRIEESTKNLTHIYGDLTNTYMLTIKALAQALEARDHYTHSHSQNVTRYSEVIAIDMKLDSQKISELKDACQLHDLGKIGIQDSILNKPGDLTPEEYEEVKQHAVKGAQILEPLTFLEGVIRIVKQHHERYDGKGYPFGLKGAQIDIGARIMTVADSYDAMTSARPYRTTPLTKLEAVEIIKKESGKQFDPQVVESFLKVVDRF